jgi:hypothetical protein
MDNKVSLGAQAIHQAEHSRCPWANESENRQERFRGYARNAIHPLNEDISVLLWALERCRGNK